MKRFALQPLFWLCDCGGSKSSLKGVSATASFVWNNVLVPTAQFIKPAVVFVWENAVVKAAILLKDVVVWSFQNVIRPVAEFIAPAAKFIWDNVIVKGFEALFGALEKSLRELSECLGFCTKMLWYPFPNLFAVWRAPLELLSLRPPIGWFPMSWRRSGVLWLKRRLPLTSTSSHRLPSALGSAIATVASGIASAWRAVAGTISAVFGG